MNKLSLHASLVVWGRPYVDLLLKVALPALAAPGNLPYLARETHLTFDIYTRAVDAESIRSHPTFQTLNRIVPIHLNPLIDTLPKRPYPSMTMNDCQRHALAKANREKAPILMLLADIIISNNLGECIHKAFMNGKRAVVAQGMRIRQETVLRFLEERYGSDPAALNLSPRELVGLGVKTLHPFIENQFINSRRFVYSAELYWWVGKSGFLARNFCLSPVAVWPMNPEALPEITFDDDYMGRAIPSPDAYHIITDSDEGVLFTLAPERYMIDPIPQTERLFSPKAYANQIARFFMTKNLGAIHSHYFLQNVRLHADDLDEAEWKQTEKKACGVASAILRSFWRQWWSMKFAAPMIRQITSFFEKAPGLTYRVLSSDFVSKHPSLCFLRQTSWNLLWRIVSPMGYPHGNAIRRFFLKLYGARVAAAVQIHSRVKIQTPWKLALHYGSVLAQGVALFGRHAITIGECAIVDMEAMLRTDGWYGGMGPPGVENWHGGSVTIDHRAFIGARSVVGPGIRVGEGEIVPPFSFCGMKHACKREPQFLLRQHGERHLIVKSLRVIFLDRLWKHSFPRLLRQTIWDIIWRFISPLGYRYGNRLRRFFLKLYGARVEKRAQIHARVRIQAPWKISLGEGCVLARGAMLCGRERIEIAPWAVVDMEAVLRTDGWYGGERDPGVDSWHSAPVIIGREAFIGSRTIIGPGARVADQETVPPFSFRGMNLSLLRDSHSAPQNGNGSPHLDRPDSSSFFPNRAAKSLTTPRVDV